MRRMNLRQRGIQAYQKVTRAARTPVVEKKPPVPETPAAEVQIKAPPFQKFTAPPLSPSSSPSATSLPSMAKKSLQDDSGLRKVAKFLVLLGQDEAAKVVRHLDPELIEPLSLEIAKIRAIPPQEAQVLLKEFGYIAAERSKNPKGGKAVAQAILEGAFGPDKSQSILTKTLPSGAPPFAFLKDLDRNALIALLGDESPAVLGIVLPFLENKQSAVFLKTLAPPLRVALIKRLAKVEKVSKEIVRKVEEGLREKMRRLGPASTEEIDGRARLAEILRHMSFDKEQSILKGLEAVKPQLGDDIRRRLFTVDQLIQIYDGDFEELLRTKTETQIALIWKGSDEPLRLKIQRNISSRRMLLVEAELDLLTGAPEREVKETLQMFLEEIRDAVREGKAVLMEGDDYV